MNNTQNHIVDKLMMRFFMPAALLFKFVAQGLSNSAGGFASGLGGLLLSAFFGAIVCIILIAHITYYKPDSKQDLAFHSVTGNVILSVMLLFNLFGFRPKARPLEILFSPLGFITLIMPVASSLIVHNVIVHSKCKRLSESVSDYENSKSLYTVIAIISVNVLLFLWLVITFFCLL